MERVQKISSAQIELDGHLQMPPNAVAFIQKIKLTFCRLSIPYWDVRMEGFNIWGRQENGFD